VALTVDGLGIVFTVEVRVIAAIKNRWYLFCIKGRRMQFYRTRASSSPAAAAAHDAAIACTPSHCFRLSWNCTTNLWRFFALNSIVCAWTEAAEERQIKYRPHQHRHFHEWSDKKCWGY
jgi:hypothetical protein